MAAFDGDRALEDVEKVSEEILRARAERKRIEAAFDAFTTGFRARQLPRESAAFPVPPPSRRVEETRPDISTVAAVEPNEPRAIPATPQATVSRKPAPRPNAILPLVAVAIVGGAVVGALMLAGRGQQPDTQVAAPEAAPASAASTPQPAVEAPAPVAKPPAPPPVAASGVNVEIRTRRRVWMRVTLDGKRAFEREVPADERIPLHADRSIVIRAGDAGALAVLQNGRDVGSLGPDGVVATREFTTAAPRR